MKAKYSEKAFHSSNRVKNLVWSVVNLRFYKVLMCEVAAAYGKQMMLLDAYYYVAANDNNPLAVSCWQTHLHTSNHFFFITFYVATKCGNCSYCCCCSCKGHIKCQVGLIKCSIVSRFDGCFIIGCIVMWFSCPFSADNIFNVWKCVSFTMKCLQIRNSTRTDKMDNK